MSDDDMKGKERNTHIYSSCWCAVCLVNVLYTTFNTMVMIVQAIGLYN